MRPGSILKRFRIFGPNKAVEALCRPYLWSIGLVGVLSVLMGLLEGVSVSLLIPLLATIDNSFPGHGGSRAVTLLEHFASDYSRTQRLLLVSFTILGLITLKCITYTIAYTFATRISGQIGLKLRSALAERLHTTSYSFFLVNDAARLLNVLNVEQAKVSESIVTLMLQVATVGMILVFSVLLFLVSWQLSLMVFLGGLATRLIQKQFERKLQQLSPAIVTSNGLLSSRMLVAVFGARVLRLFHTQTFEQARFDEVSEDVRQATQRQEDVMGVRGPALEVVRMTMLLIVLLLSLNAGVSLPVLAAFLALMNRLQPHIQVLETASAGFASASAHYGEVEWLLQAAGRTEAPAGTIAFERLKHEIRFHNVSYQYPNRSEAAIEQLDFVIEQGRSTALIGSSGDGKSTVINLLMQLLHPTSGTITVDGTPLSEIQLSDWLGACAIAGQDIDLVDGTIAENICYGSTGLDHAAIEDAVRAANAEFVYALPLGLETVVGRLGLSLSGGQRQRIALARALARKPTLLILDEATNAIDQDTEDSIIRTLRSLPKSMTVLVVSHRPTTLAFCENAIVLRRGRVVQSGSLSSVSKVAEVMGPLIAVPSMEM